MDDLAQRAMLEGVYPLARAPWDLFTFTGETPEDNARLIAHGSLPWWSDLNLRLSAWRPLSSLLVWFDVRVLGDDPRAAHLHSLLWWSAAMVAAALVLFTVLPRHWATASLLLYGLDDAHAFPVTWLANRSALCSAAFGFLALWAHLRWRTHASHRYLVLAMASLTGALAAGEYGLCIVGFVLAYELVGAEDARGVRARALVPTAGVLALYLLVHRVGGFGTRASGVYVDPLREPGAYLTALGQRFPALLGDMVLGLPASTTAFMPWLALGAAAVVLAAASRSGARAAALRWMPLGAALALLPVASSFLSGRLTVIAALGTHVAVTAVLCAAWDDARDRDRRRRPGAWVRIAIALGLAAMHLGVVPYRGWREIQSISDLNAAGRRAAATMPVDDATAANERWAALSVSDPMLLIYPPLLRWTGGHPLPRAWSVLSMAPHRHRMTRIDDRTLTLQAEDGAMLRTPVERLFRRPDVPLHIGDRIDLGDLEITVLQTAPDGAPTHVQYRFDVPLEHPSLRLLLVGQRGFIRYPMGGVGVSMTVPPGTHPLGMAPG
jgi:hypothetical protein